MARQQVGGKQNNCNVSQRWVCDLAVTTPLCWLHNIQSPTCRQWKWEKLNGWWYRVGFLSRVTEIENCGKVPFYAKKKITLPVYSNKHGTSNDNISLALLFSKCAKICDPLWCHKGHFETYASGVMTGIPLITTPLARFQTANGHLVRVIVMASAIAITFTVVLCLLYNSTREVTKMKNRKSEENLTF